MTENITVYTQNSIRITDGERVIYVDPFHMNEAPHDADLILITHDHYDHFSPDDIAKVAGENTTLAVPEKMEKKAREAAGAVKQTVTVTPGGSFSIEGVELETVPAYNILKPFHPKGAGWVGYIITADGSRIYVAGDTDATKEAKEVKCDVAIVPIGGTYTMDVKKAAELVNAIKPSVAIPVHYGSIVGSPEDGEAFARLVSEPVSVECMITF